MYDRYVFHAFGVARELRAVRPVSGSETRRTFVSHLFGIRVEYVLRQCARRHDWMVVVPVSGLKIHSVGFCVEFPVGCFPLYFRQVPREELPEGVGVRDVFLVGDCGLLCPRWTDFHFHLNRLDEFQRLHGGLWKLSDIHRFRQWWFRWWRRRGLVADS